MPSSPLTNIEPPANLSPFKQLIVNAAIAVARSGRRITPESIAQAIGMPAAWVRQMWRIRPMEESQ